MRPDNIFIFSVGLSELHRKSVYCSFLKNDKCKKCHDESLSFIDIIFFSCQSNLYRFTCRIA